MRILMVNLADWNSMSGGALHQLALFEAFREAGHDIRMITSGTDECAAMPFGVREASTIVRTLRGIGLPANLNTLAQLPALIAEIVRFRPDVVYSRANSLTIALTAVCRAMGTRVVLEHNSWLESQRRAASGSRLLASIERLAQTGAARLADGSRCVTEGLSDRLTQAGVSSRRLAAIGNGTDCERFRPIARSEALAQFGLPDDRSYIGFVGNRMPWHGLGTALEGFAKLAPQFPDADLLLIGDGPGRAPVVEHARRLGLSSRVRTPGRVPFGQANAAINCFDLAILPVSLAYDTGFSAIKLRDYAAAGRVVLTSHVPGNIELSGESWILTHAPDNAGDFASALGLWLESRHGDAGHWDIARERARQYALGNFAWSRIANEILTFISSLEPALLAEKATGRLNASALRS
jgi:glycosyltransferase involved in cell wall biosynthesis